ncbi:MAG TPA: hypothetical protein VN027_01975 [Isoptericola sp.]|nr:hypothetical protein [Isoptericola sp.]
MTISLLTVITALGWVGAVAVVLAYGMVSKGRWTADSLPFQLSNVAGAAVMLVIAIVNGIWPSALSNVAAVIIGAAALRTLARARRAERAAAAQLAAVQAIGDPHAVVVLDGAADPAAGALVADALVDAEPADVTELPRQERVDLAA